jgi:hypothetical protein
MRLSLCTALLALSASITLALLAACSSSDPAAVPALDAGGAPTDVGTTETGATEGGPAADGGTDAPDPGAPLPSGVRDRDGRPYVSLVLVSAANREAYNAEKVESASTIDPPIDADGGTAFGDDFQQRLVMLDGLDGTNDWNGGAADAGHDDAGVYPHPLSNAWITVDALLVDPNKPFSAAGYLDIEANGASHTTCGGRWIGDDALDKTMSFLVKKSLVGIKDGVDAPAKAASLTFPYLAEPF